MRSVADYEVKYINATEYFCALNRTAMDLFTEILREAKKEFMRCDFWCNISVCSALRFLSLQRKFYAVEFENPMHAELFLPTLEKLGVIGFIGWLGRANAAA